MSTDHSLPPLLVDAETGEPYLRLPKPLDNNIITPPRLTDAEALAGILSNNGVAKWLTFIPQPYGIKEAEEWLTFSKEQTDEIFRDVRQARSEGTFVDSCPVRTLREVQSDGSQVMIGSIGIGRNSFSFLENDEERKQMAEGNLEKATGDLEITWEAGDYLASSHHDRGIMTTAIGTILRDWAIPHMNAHHIVAAPYVGNVASVRVFEKNGFVLGRVAMKESVTLGGQTHMGQSILSWERTNMLRAV